MSVVGIANEIESGFWRFIAKFGKKADADGDTDTDGVRLRLCRAV